MNKEIKVLYKIFELVLTPPFSLELEGHDMFDILDKQLMNRHMVHIGWYYPMSSIVELTFAVETSILSKIRLTFNVDKYSNDDVLLIAKHLVNWLQDNFPEKLDGVKFWNTDTYNDIY